MNFKNCLISSNITNLLQFIYAVTPGFSIIEQILATFEVNKCFINLITNSSNLGALSPPFKLRALLSGSFLFTWNSY